MRRILRLCSKIQPFVTLVIVAGKPGKQRGMSGGVIAGIVVPLLLVPILVVLVCFFLKKKKKDNNQGGRNSAYTVYCEYHNSFFVCFPFARAGVSSLQIVAGVGFLCYGNKKACMKPKSLQ